MHGRVVDPQRLRRLIAERGLTITAFRERAQLSRAMTSAVLADPPRRNLSELAAVRVSDVLRCEVEEFTSASPHGVD